MASIAITAAVAAVGAATMSAVSARQQGIATQRMDRQKANVEKENATQQQINMRQKMLQALATQNAQAGVGNVGLNRAGTLRQITQASNDLLVSNANSSASISLLDQAGANAAAAGSYAAAADIFGGIKGVATSGVGSLVGGGGGGSGPNGYGGAGA